MANERTNEKRRRYYRRRAHLDRAHRNRRQLLVDRTKELIAEGNVGRLIIHTSDDKKLLEVPLTSTED